MSYQDKYWAAWIALSVMSFIGLLLSKRTKPAPRNRIDPYRIRWQPAVRDNERRTA